ncbi:hypothetical protein PENCOP_c001G04546 [Penicillium coprophilum]|uniref:Uncharacterized protein n=1 Tax=Penicillium coprophilum TaxID=36646 RepID=A0A1V6V8P2_9EURO|nr:hypothetical protein PENCOP_c001G04546 [Penicillium coprophilum]
MTAVDFYHTPRTISSNPVNKPRWYVLQLEYLGPTTFNYLPQPLDRKINKGSSALPPALSVVGAKTFERHMEYLGQVFFAPEGRMVVLFSKRYEYCGTSSRVFSKCAGRLKLAECEYESFSTTQ